MGLENKKKPNLDLSVLILAYRRHENTTKILKACAGQGIFDIYVSIDGVREVSENVKRDHDLTIKAVNDFERSLNIKVNKKFSLTNLGCAVSVINGIDWAFETSKNLIVLEDDCLPSPDFFRFIANQFEHLQTTSDIWLICGTQFAPSQVTGNLPALSKYALTWGWATSREKWRLIRPVFSATSRNLYFESLSSLKPEIIYWNSGRRRALLGYTDVWDTIMVREMQKQKTFAILPPVNLVKNTGNDIQATNVDANSQWTNLPVQPLPSSGLDSPRLNSSLDNWLKKHFYQIGIRHLITTKYTLFLDLFLKKSKRFKSHLPDRLNYGNS